MQYGRIHPLGRLLLIGCLPRNIEGTLIHPIVDSKKLWIY